MAGRKASMVDRKVPPGQGPSSTSPPRPCHDAAMDKEAPAGNGQGGTPDSLPPFAEGAELEFPVTFDLRIIYTLAEGGSIQDDLERIYTARGVKCSLMQGISKPGAKYGRMGSRLTFTSREQMYSTYSDIGKLPYVKTAI